MISELVTLGIVSGSIYCLIAVGFAIIYQARQTMNFALGAIYALGAYMGYLFSVQLGVPRFPSFALACLVGGLTGSISEIVIYAPMRRRSATNNTLTIASLGLYIILENTIALVWGDDTRSIRTTAGTRGHEVWGGSITDAQISILVASSLIVTGLTIVLTQTRLGITFRATVNDPELARLSGINSDRYMIFAYGLGSFLVAVAAILVSFDTDLSPTMGFSALVKGVIAVIIGGMGSLPGAALGGLFLGLSESLVVNWLPSQWQDSAAFVILILFLLLRPYGILGKRPQKAIV